MLLVDESNHPSVLSPAQSKSKAVVQWVLGAEIYAFADTIDKALLI